MYLQHTRYGSSPQPLSAPSTSHFKQTPTFKVLLKEIMWPKGNQTDLHQKILQAKGDRTVHGSKLSSCLVARNEHPSGWSWWSLSCEQWYMQCVCAEHRRTTYPLHTPKQLDNDVKFREEMVFYDFKEIKGTSILRNTWVDAGCGWHHIRLKWDVPAAKKAPFSSFSHLDFSSSQALLAIWTLKRGGVQPFDTAIHRSDMVATQNQH